MSSNITDFFIDYLASQWEFTAVCGEKEPDVIAKLYQLSDKFNKERAAILREGVPKFKGYPDKSKIPPIIKK